MRRPATIMLTLAAAWLVCTANAQPTVTRPALQPRPLPYAPLPNGAFACYADQGSVLSPYAALPNLAGRDLAGLVTWSTRMTNEACRATCGNLNFKYAGTQSGAFCFCADNAGAHGTSPSCNTGCNGSPGQICGGALANSVSNAAFVPPPAPPFPSNGGQCIMDVSGPGYRHYEVQTWVVTGPRTGDPNTVATYPMTWSTIGQGAFHETSGVRAWHISGGASVVYRTTVIASNKHLLLGQQSTLGQATLTETQTKIDNGAPRTPTTTTGSWSEYQAPGIDVAPMPTLPPVIATMQTFTTQTYAAPGGTSGTVNCKWNVIR